MPYLNLVVHCSRWPHYSNKKGFCPVEKGRILNLWNIFFFLPGFSFTDTDDLQDSRGREGPSFIPLYHFHPLTYGTLYITCQVNTWSVFFSKCTDSFDIFDGLLCSSYLVDTFLLLSPTQSFQ